MRSPSWLSPGSFFSLLGCPKQTLVTAPPAACLRPALGRGQPGAGSPPCWDWDGAAPCTHNRGDTAPWHPPGDAWVTRAELHMGRNREVVGVEAARARWMREGKQSICDVRRFLMRPVACLPLRGSSRRRRLPKLSTAHCSKTLDCLVPGVEAQRCCHPHRARGEGHEAGQPHMGPQIMAGAASVPTSPGHLCRVSPILGTCTEE